VTENPFVIEAVSCPLYFIHQHQKALGSLDW